MMSRLPILLLAVLLAVSPVMAAAGIDGHAHHGTAGHAPADHPEGGHGHPAAAPDGRDCAADGPDHCCGEAEIACHGAAFLPAPAAGGAAFTAASAPLLLGHDGDPDSPHPEDDPPPPRA